MNSIFFIPTNLFCYSEKSKFPLTYFKRNTKLCSFFADMRAAARALNLFLVLALCVETLCMIADKMQDFGELYV